MGVPVMFPGDYVWRLQLPCSDSCGSSGNRHHRLAFCENIGWVRLRFFSFGHLQYILFPPPPSSVTPTSPLVFWVQIILFVSLSFWENRLVATFFRHRGTSLLRPLLWFVQCFVSSPLCDPCSSDLVFRGKRNIFILLYSRGISRNDPDLKCEALGHWPRYYLFFIFTLEVRIVWK